MILFANGEINDLAGAKDLIQAGDTIIAVDGGARFCKRLGLIPDVLIGDLDSLSEEEILYFQKLGTQILRFDPKKDETDLELALFHALKFEANEVVILGGLGRRLDHTLGNLLLLAHPSLNDIKISFWEDGQWIYLIRDRLTLEAQIGTNLSLIPVGGDVEGVSTEGLEWPLKNERLSFGATRGISNVTNLEQVTIEIKNGLLLCVLGSKEQSIKSR